MKERENIPTPMILPPSSHENVITAFNEMIERVESLWIELKIPPADLKFYRDSLCKSPPDSLEQCQEISKYILILKLHRTATLSVLTAIEG
jgi:hypothetical protein